MPQQRLSRLSRVQNAVELAALYYYARNKEEARLKAEFARLHYKYPGFEMPADLYQPAAKPVDESKLWTLYGKVDFAGVDAELARLAAERPDWKPSADFQSKLARKKMRFAVTAAVKARNWQGVAAAGATIDPATEKEVDLVWDMIDAYSALGDRDRLGALLSRADVPRSSHAIPQGRDRRDDQEIDPRFHARGCARRDGGLRRRSGDQRGSRKRHHRLTRRAVAEFIIPTRRRPNHCPRPISTRCRLRRRRARRRPISRCSAGII